MMWLVLMLALAGDRTTDAPGATVPSVRWSEPDALEEAWRDVRRSKPGGADRVKTYLAQGLEHAACRGLVDLRTLTHDLAWQNDIALREWARPALAEVLIAAHRAFRERYPKQVIGVGDVAQAGCGQIDPGTLTRWVSGGEATDLLARASEIGGVPTIVEIDGDVLTERRVVGRDADLLFVQVRRYRDLGEAIGGVEDKVRTVLASGTLVDEQVGPDHVRQHWVDAKYHRQVILVLTRGVAPRALFRLADARDIRLSPWAPARPGTTRGERRWRREAGTWRGYDLLEEGSHATHMAGLDADLSYPMVVPERRFALDPAGIDSAATWAWFEALVAAGERLGTPIARIVVGGRVLPKLYREVPGAKQSPVAKLLVIVGNHDDHLHVRLARPTPEADAAALARLSAIAFQPAQPVEPSDHPRLDERSR